MTETYHSTTSAHREQLKPHSRQVEAINRTPMYPNAQRLDKSVWPIPHTSTTRLAWCAEYVNDELLKMYNIRYPKYFLTKEQLKEHYGVIGDAWTLYHNIMSHWGKKICNVFPASVDSKLIEQMGEDPYSIITDNRLLYKTEKILHKATTKAYDLSKNPIDKVEYLRTAIATYRESLLPHKQLMIKSLHIWDVVWLYYAASGSQLRSYRESLDGTFNTHVWYVTGITQSWIPIISHNIHGVVYNQTLDELWDTPASWTNKCAITWAVRPRFVW